MNYYKIRIDADQHSFAEIEHFISEFTTTYVGCYEENKDGSNPHTHWYVESSTKKSTIRQRIRRYVGRGNGNYSLKEVDERFPPEYLRYITKDGRIVYHPNFDKDIINKAIKDDKELKKQLKDKRKDKKSEYKKLEEYVVKLHEECCEYFYSKNHYYPDMSSSEILQYVIRYYKEKEKLVRKFAIISQVQTLSLKYDPGYEGYLSNSWLKDI